MSDVAYATATTACMVRNHTGNPLPLDVKVTLGATELKKDDDYVVLYNGSTDAPHEAKEYQVSIKGCGDTYTGEKALGTYTIHSNPGLDPNKPYAIASAQNANQVLDCYNAKTANGTNVNLWRNSAQANQMWKLSLDRNTGLFRIASASADSQVLDIYGGKAVNGANANLWKDSGAANQRWVLIPHGDAWAIASAADPTKVLDAYNAGTANGTNVDLWQDKGGSHQRWTLQDMSDRNRTTSK